MDIANCRSALKLLQRFANNYYLDNIVIDLITTGLPPLLSIIDRHFENIYYLLSAYRHFCLIIRICYRLTATFVKSLIETAITIVIAYIGNAFLLLI